tara:strand:- start:5843 stop:6634 length:792 start_codon:yes stop_codon:yes gene_type:complete
MRPIFLLSFLLFGLFTMAQKKSVLNTYDDGSVMRERIKFPEYDTILERIYFKNGTLNNEYQIVSNQRNGYGKTFNENGIMIFKEFYSQGKLNGKFTCYRTNGTIQRTEMWQNNFLVDTTKYFNEAGGFLMLRVYETPCERGSDNCDYSELYFIDDELVYSYDFKNGLKNKSPEIYNETKYQVFKLNESKLAMNDKGQSLFRANCASCHKTDKQFIGPPLQCSSEKLDNESYWKKVSNGSGHPKAQINRKEFDLLYNWIETNCP